MDDASTSNPSPAMDRLPTREGYDRWAACYDDEDNPLIALEEPKVAELLGPVSGLRILDLGCGTGRHALRLAAAGANVTAVDFSEGMLARARAGAGTLALDFRTHDLTRPLPFAELPRPSINDLAGGLLRSTPGKGDKAEGEVS